MAKVVVVAVDEISKAAASEVPNGAYSGVWSGSEVFAVCGKKRYRFVTQECVRGTGLVCVVNVQDGAITVEIDLHFESK